MYFARLFYILDYYTRRPETLREQCLGEISKVARASGSNCVDVMDYVSRAADLRAISNARGLLRE